MIEYLQHLFHWRIRLILVVFSLTRPAAASITIIDDDGNQHVVIKYFFCDNIILSDVVIGFVPPAYTVVEGVDQFTSLTVQLISG